MAGSHLEALRVGHNLVLHACLIMNTSNSYNL